MQYNPRPPSPPPQGGGFSVVRVERVLRQAHPLGLFEAGAQLPLGHPSRRINAYRPEQRWTAVLAGLTSGLKRIAPGNTAWRPNTAVPAWLGGRFPDPGTSHRWLEQVSDVQAAAVRRHGHPVVRQHARFGHVLRSGQWLVVDVDGQGLVARGQRFEKAAVGYLGAGVDRGYQRYVC